jgi:hypothetical protein
VRIFRKVESGIGRALLALAAFLVATLLVAVLIGVANSNLFWGEDNQYGRVDIPGKAVLHLPQETVQVTAAAALPGRGNETGELLTPKIGVAAVPVEGGADAKVRTDVGSSTNADDSEVDTQRRIAYLDVPKAGDYVVKVSGSFVGYGVNGQLWFGYEPGFVHGSTIWLVAMAIVLAVIGIIYLVSRLRAVRRAKVAGGPEGTG